MSQILAVPSETPQLTQPKFSNLPTLPEVTCRILSLAKDPSSSPAELQRLICSDVAMSTRILKVVNSAFYGLSRQIGSIDRAVIVLGRNAVRNIAVAASMVKIFQPSLRQDATAFDPRQLWMHSTGTAAAARLLSTTLQVGDVNELFLAGLTHDIGLIAQMHWAPARFQMCLNEVQPDGAGVPQQDLRQCEQSVFGLDHAALGRQVCEYWNFPDVIGQLVGDHHTPFIGTAESRAEACLIHLADLLAASMPDGFRLDLPCVEPPEDLLDELNLQPDQLPQLRQQLAVAMQEVASLLTNSGS